MGKEVQRWDPPNKEIPKYPIPLWGATSKYVKVEEHNGPVFPVNRNNDYAASVPKRNVPEEPKSLSYPVCQIEKNSHCFKGDVPPDVKLPKLLIGPKLIENGKSGFLPTTPISEKTPQINAPVFNGVEASNKFSPMLPPKIEGEVLMSTPMFPCEHGSKYTPPDFGCSGKGLTIHRQKVLNAPGNRDSGDRNSCIIDAKNKYQLEQLENGFPQGVKTGTLTKLMGPKYL